MQKIKTLLIAIISLLFFVVLASEVMGQELTAGATATTYNPDPNLLPILIVMSILTILTNGGKLLKTFFRQK